MSREDVKKMLGENATDEQISAVLNLFHTEISKKDNELSEAKKQNEKYSNYEELVEENKKLKDSQLTEQQKLEAMKKETENNFKESKVIVNRAKAKDILAGYDVSDELLDSFVSDDEKSSVDKATAFKNYIDAKTTKIVAETEEKISKTNVKPPVSNKKNENSDELEKFNKMGYQERIELKQENPELFEQLNSQEN